jgi:hypothetical protein
MYPKNANIRKFSTIKLKSFTPWYRHNPRLPQLEKLINAGDLRPIKVIQSENSRPKSLADFIQKRSETNLFFGVQTDTENSVRMAVEHKMNLLNTNKCES